MTAKIIDSKALSSWVDKLIKKTAVYGPVKEGNRYIFDTLTESADLQLDYDITTLPPKKYLLPQTETILKFEGAARFEGVENKDPFVLFGVHPYDMHAINQMDAFFSKDHKDSPYFARRENATIVVTDPEAVADNTFASSMNTTSVKDGFDVIMTRNGDKIVVEARTEKGEALLKELKGAKDAAKGDLDAREQIQKENEKKFNKHILKTQLSELSKVLEKSYEHDVWKDMSKNCFSCGSCNLVCPTCYCFDVQDDMEWNMKCGSRCRSWDGCLLKEFAIVAGNHNFRKDKSERYRHRFFRKGKYLYDTMGHVSCVGCGRCVSACVPNIANPVEVYNKLVEA